MRIVVHGQQAFGKAVLEALLERKENVIAVYVEATAQETETRLLNGLRKRCVSATVLPTLASM